MVPNCVPEEYVTESGDIVEFVELDEGQCSTSVWPGISIVVFVLGNDLSISAMINYTFF